MKKILSRELAFLVSPIYCFRSKAVMKKRAQHIFTVFVSIIALAAASSAIFKRPDGWWWVLAIAGFLFGVAGCCAAMLRDE
ncbi:hypothetical protein [Diaphorobacter sp.]|uniref:hypothetical protein n=1 Tax=Diaphorobacter sp. TaxID=1934310 RepID=UPI00258C5A88|nr:hypothetical protein [Diaphorobacter sp.]